MEVKLRKKEKKNYKVYYVLLIVVFAISLVLLLKRNSFAYTDSTGNITNFHDYSELDIVDSNYSFSTIHLGPESEMSFLELPRAADGNPAVTVSTNNYSNGDFSIQVPTIGNFSTGPVRLLVTKCSVNNQQELVDVVITIDNIRVYDPYLEGDNSPSFVNFSILNEIASADGTTGLYTLDTLATYPMAFRFSSNNAVADVSVDYYKTGKYQSDDEGNGQVKANINKISAFFYGLDGLNIIDGVSKSLENLYFNNKLSNVYYNKGENGLLGDKENYVYVNKFAEDIYTVNNYGINTQDSVYVLTDSNDSSFKFSFGGIYTDFVYTSMSPYPYAVPPVYKTVEGESIVHRPGGIEKYNIVSYIPSNYPAYLLNFKSMYRNISSKDMIDRIIITDEMDAFLEFQTFGIANEYGVECQNLFSNWNITTDNKIIINAGNSCQLNPDGTMSCEDNNYNNMISPLESKPNFFGHFYNFEIDAQIFDDVSKRSITNTVTQNVYFKNMAEPDASSAYVSFDIAYELRVSHILDDDITQKIVDDIVTLKYYGDEYTARPLTESEIPDEYKNYHLATTDTVHSGYITRDVSIVYTYPSQWVINYIDKDTNSLIEIEELENPKVIPNRDINNDGEIDESDLTSYKIDISGYAYDSYEDSINSRETNIYYTKSKHSYTVNYYEKVNGENTTIKVANSKNVSDIVHGTEITENAIDVTGYNKVTPTSQTITINENGIVINFYYQKKSDLSYTVNYYEEGTTNKVATSKVVNNQTFGEQITENAIDVTGYNKVTPTSQTITINENGNVINFYYQKKNNLSYTVNYYKKVNGENTTIKVANSKTVGNQVFHSHITAASEVITIPGYAYDSFSIIPSDENYPEELIINVGDNIINLYYVERTDYQYTINYLEKGTSNILHQAKTGYSTLNATILAQNEIITIADYDYDSCDKANISVSENASSNIINLYYVKGTGKVIVRHIDIVNNTDIIENQTITGTIGDSYQTSPNSTILETYDLVNTEGNENGTYKRENQEIKYYYQKKYHVTTVVDGEGGTITGNENVMEGESSTVDNIVITPRAGYRIKKITINGNEIPITNESKMVLENFQDMHEDKNIVVEFELIEYEIVVKYIDELTNNKLKADLIFTKHYQEEYEVEKENFDGYEFIRVEGKEKDTVLRNAEIIYYYHKLGYVKINHIDKTTNNKLLEEDEQGLIGDNYTAYPKNFPSYNLIIRPDEETKEIIDGTITFNYYYIRVSGGVLEKHVDEYSNALLENPISHTGNVGDEYTINSKSFQGYDLNTNRLPSNSHGNLKIDAEEVIYYYKRRGTLIIKYQDEITKGNLHDENVINKYYGDEYEVKPIEIPGYKLVSEEKSVGTITKDEQEIIYYYRKLFKVTTKVNGIGGTIVGDESVMEGYDSTKDNIKIKVDNDFYISKITVNGEEITINDHYNETLANFQDMHEDKEIVVFFEQIIHDVPKTDKGTILPYIAIGTTLLGGLFIYLAQKNKHKKKEAVPYE